MPLWRSGFQGWSPVEVAAGALAFLGFSWLAILHVTMIAADAPMEMREGAMLATTTALLDGHNPYAMPGVMQTGNAYGILYPIAVVPVAWLVGPSYVAHRLVAAIGIVGACFIVFRWLRLARIGWPDALLGTALVYAGLIYFTGGVARPDGIGVFLMLAAVETMRKGNLDGRSFAAGMLLSMLGLLCKLYFVWPAFAGAAYVFLCRGWRRGLVYGAAASVATVATLAIATIILPGYAAFVLLANLRDVDYVPSYLLVQIRDWALFDLPFLAAGLVALFAARWSRPSWRERDRGLFAAMTGLGAVALIFCLGGHTGAHLSYFFQLLSPFLAVVVLSAAGRNRKALAAFRVALPLAVLANAHWFPLSATRIAQAAADFSADRALIDRHRHVLATTEFAGALALSHRDLAETGHSEYFVNATIGDPPFWLRPLLPKRAELAAEWEATRDAIATRIARQEYDLALIGPLPSDLIPMTLLADRYEATASLIIDMPWALQRWPVGVWRPRPGE